MSETKKLNAACIRYLSTKKHDIGKIMGMTTLDLLRLVAEEHAKEVGAEVTVSYHFEGDNR